ncbi:flavodoxin family protein [Anaeramoeba ignava]|uniref:Flavodoxin family protein n=1 Tax=Anaeramoeba ignava TaxID=1746090 RepID=A0A9Q0LL26_ANAIG|nr:flavodoxin family protein [Anaeramoeba ignava]
MSKAILFEKLDNKSVKCTCCYRRCVIANGKTGECGVRKNRNGELFLEVYGYGKSVHVDPIEKKPLRHFYPSSFAYSIGSIGCNFTCSFCQNWKTSMATRQGIDIEDLDIGKKLSPEQIVKNCIKENCKSIAYTYNEPTIFAEYIYDTAKLAHKKGIKNVMVSNGYMSPETIELLSPYIDGINIDLKAFTNEFYQNLSGVRLSPVLRNIERWYRLGVWVELTTLVIPDENDSDEELENIAKFIYGIDKNIPWNVSAYHDDFKMQNHGRTPLETLKRAYKIGKKQGLNHIYLGNVRSDKHTSTYCPNCNKMIMKRQRRVLIEMNISKGCCKFCGTEVKGIWSDEFPKPYLERPKDIKDIIYETNSNSNILDIRQNPTFSITHFDKEHRIAILFGTQTGTTEELAHQLLLRFRLTPHVESSFDINVIDLENYSVENLPSESIVIILTSTYGNGEPPQNAHRLWKYLQSFNSNQTPHLLESIKYSILGIGSSIYSENYQKFSRFLDHQFEKLGAEKILPLNEIDITNPSSNTFNSWSKNLIKEIVESQGIVVKENQLKNSNISQNKFEIQMDESNQNVPIQNFVNENNQKMYYDHTNPYISEIIQKKELSQSGKKRSYEPRSVYFLEMRINSRIMKYEAGDHLCVFPENDPKLVTQLCERIKIDPMKPIMIKNDLRFQNTITIGEFLTKYVDISSILPQNSLLILSQYCKNKKEKKKILLYESNQEIYQKEIMREKLNIIDVLKKFPSIEIEFQELVNSLPRMAPRLYSIASSFNSNPESVGILVRVVQNGLCSGYLSHKEIGSKISIFLQKSTFKYNPKIPSVFIAAGIGIAPFYGMLMERTLVPDSQRKSLVFIYGCRNSNDDFLLKKEIFELKENHLIDKTLFAFSRESNKKVYVQHVLKDNIDCLKDISQNQGNIFLCGTIQMGKDVRKVLESVFGDLSVLRQKQRLFEEYW